MTVLRRHSASVAALLLITVAVQMLDMDLCCEVDRSARSQAETESLLLSEGAVAGMLPSASGGEEGAHEHAAQPDCLCHLIFISTDATPAVQAVRVPTPLRAEVQESPYSTALSPPGPIPIA